MMWRNLIVVLTALLLGGCAGMGRHQTVTINAIAAQDADNYHTYVLLPVDSKVDELEFNQYADQLQIALSEKGLTRVPQGNKPEMVIFLLTNVGEIKTVTRTGAIPQWGQTGYSGSSTYGSVTGNTFSSTTTYRPTYGVTGYVPYSRTETYVPVGFSVSAYTQDPQTKQTRQIWRMAATSISDRGDMRAAFPALLMTAKPYIGSDTHGMIDVPIKAPQK